MNKWQPIETAPKDGSGIISFEKCGDKGLIGLVSFNKGGDNQWRDGEGCLHEPTHWRPFPRGPKNEKCIIE